MLAARPGFAAVAVLSLALGIGSTTAIFTVIYAVLVDPYPYRAPERIGQLILTDQRGREREVVYTKPQYLDIESQLPEFPALEDAIAYSRDAAVLRGESLAEVVAQERCSSNFFTFFGVAPLLGRTFTQQEISRTSAPEPVAVLSYQFWQRVFFGRRDIVGKQLRLDNGLYTVIGVMPVRFTWTDADVYTPMDTRAGGMDLVSVFYRERPNISQAQIRSEFAPLLEQFRKQSPRYFYPDGPLRFKYQTVSEGILGTFENTLLALFGAVTLLLLIACGNVANLLLARAATREGEMAVRTSLGATRPRLITQLLTESVTLALAGGVLGIGFAFGAIRAVVALMPQYSIPHEAVIALNWPVLVFALAVSISTGLVFGAAPAWHISREPHNETLRGATKGSGVTSRQRLVLDALISGEVALSLLLLTGAGVAVNGFLSLERKTLGYDPRSTVSFLLPLSEGRYTTWASREALFQRVETGLRQLPNVAAVSMTETGLPPMTGGLSKITIDAAEPRAVPEASINLTGDGYFATVRTPVVRGREFTADEIAQAKPVAVITKELAKAAFPAGESPLGHHIEVRLFKEPLPPAYLKASNVSRSFEIVGVVGDARNRGLSEQPVPGVFVPFTTFCAPSALVLVRARAGDPGAVLNDIRAVVRAADPDQPITQVRTLEDWLSNATAYPKFATFLFGVFGTLGMSLSAFGVFSVVSYAVAHRVREFGIRTALGATTGDVLRHVLGGVGRVLAIGLIAGFALSTAATKLLLSQLKGMGNADWPVLVLAGFLLALSTGLACIWPARTAALVQPMEALRHE